MLRFNIAVILGFFCVTALVACTQQDPRAQGKALFDNNCAACHGADARGNGPLAASSGLNAVDLTVLSSQNGGVFPIDTVITQIHGYPGRYLTGAMPEYHRVLDSPMVEWTTQDGTVIPTPKKVLAIAQYLETVQG